jgi:amino acid permease
MRNAVVAALVSALVSASGTYAASRVLITSTHQIAPPVLAQLAKLKARTAYVQGAPGPEGKARRRR